MWISKQVIKLFHFAAQIGNRIIKKRIHVRIEHVAPSRCREEFLERTKKNDAIKHEAKERGGESALDLAPAPALKPLFSACLRERPNSHE
jgi:hypothetical protein